VLDPALKHDDIEVRITHLLPPSAVQSGPPHIPCYFFTTALYRDTGKIHLVQEALAHSDLSTTMIYTHIHDPEVEEALKSFRQPTAVATA